MRLLFLIPHFFHVDGREETKPSLRGKHASITASREVRIAALRKTVLSLHQSFGGGQAMISHAERRTTPANAPFHYDVHVVVVTNGHSHLLSEAGMDDTLYHHVNIEGEPTRLGFACQNVLRDRWGNYEFYCYLEDDLALVDPWFFEKLRWFNSHVGDDNVLLPNRFERSETHAYKKCYVDGDLAKRVTQPFQDTSVVPELKSTVLGRPVRMVRPLNPHSGCFFLNAEQMSRWIGQPYFEKQEIDFIGPLESAATLGVMKTFRVYKPAPENASFLEIEHHDSRYIELIRM